MAITEIQLKQARDTLYAMESEIKQLLSTVNFIISPNVPNSLTLSADQIQTLKDEYSNTKGELVTLYHQLP